MRLDDTVRIPLYARGALVGYTLIDDADADFVNQWRWSMSKDGYVYRSVWIPGVGGRAIRLHRELLGLAFGDERNGDHINRVRTDNRRTNLRILLPGENNHNRSNTRGSSSAYRGVCWDSTNGKWHAQIRVNGQGRHLGYFTDEEVAAAVAKEARQRLLPFAVD